jgi:hypothetical protein
MYKDEDEDVISPEGANRFFEDLHVSMEGVRRNSLAASGTVYVYLYGICLISLLDSADRRFLEAQCQFHG